MNAAHPVRIALLARRTAAYPFKVWGFGESIAMEALLAAGGAAGDHARDLLRRWALEAGPLSGDPLAHVAPGVPLLRLYQESGDARLLRRAVELAEVLVGL